MDVNAVVEVVGTVVEIAGVGIIVIGALVSSGIALVRVVRRQPFLSFSLELEISGRWPWQKRQGTPPQSEAEAAPVS